MASSQRIVARIAPGHTKRQRWRRYGTVIEDPGHVHCSDRRHRSGSIGHPHPVQKRTPAADRRPAIHDVPFITRRTGPWQKPPAREPHRRAQRHPSQLSCNTPGLRAPDTPRVTLIKLLITPEAAHGHREATTSVPTAALPIPELPTTSSSGPAERSGRARSRESGTNAARVWIRMVVARHHRKKDSSGEGSRFGGAGQPSRRKKIGPAGGPL
jgi:hypothetical protein